MKGNQRKGVAVYCRVDRGKSPEARMEALRIQRQRLKAYAEERGLPIAGYYVDDEFPGSMGNRPGLEQLGKDYDAGMFEQVLVVNRSRLYRRSQEYQPQWPFPICSLNQLEQDRTD
ncbi:MAG: recombinase family protein [Lachnospiraceae bacterium]|jgi:DNA invertase Pin-like site-specific DNA recombinase|nr:recombinase family protein [Lachnospiraceae bacterium]